MAHDSRISFLLSILTIPGKDKMALPVAKYATVPEALDAIGLARDFQTSGSAWPATTGADAGGRTAEEWLCLLQHYQNKIMHVYAESDGDTPEGRARFAKYAAILANLALWLVQSTQGPVLADRKES